MQDEFSTSTQEQERQERPLMTQDEKKAGVPYQETVNSGEKVERVVNEWGEEPTEEELQTLRKVSGKLPLAAFLVAIVELAERFTYYGLSGVFQNYMSLARSNQLQNGALGWGHSTATALSNFFQFWCYVTPVGMAVLSDMKLGRYNTIMLSSFIYVIGNIILLCTSIPPALEGNPPTAGRAGLIVAMIVLGLGTGGIKSNVAPLIADQYLPNRPYLDTLKSGERVIIDPTTTIQRIFMIFYWCINLGSLSAIATTELEKNVDFWAAYLLPTCFFFIAILVLFLGRNKYIRRPPTGSPIPNTIKVLWLTIINGFKGKKGVKTHNDHLVKSFTFDVARPEVRAEKGLSPVSWDNRFVDQVYNTMIACKVFLFYPIYWAVYSQMLNNFISQAGTMETHGIPNDIMQNIDPIALIIFIPIMDRWVYPGLKKCGIKMLPMTRIFWGFIFGAGAMAYAAGVQKMIYDAGPCYDAPLACPDAGPDGTIPNHVHVAVQTPAYVLIAISEIFASITGLEYAYTKAPVTMKSLVMSLFLLTNAFGSILGICISSTAVDPKLLPMYYSLAIVATVTAGLFWLIYGKYNKMEEEMNKTQRELDTGDDSNSYAKAEVALEGQAAGGHAIGDGLEPVMSALSRLTAGGEHADRSALSPVVTSASHLSMTNNNLAKSNLM